MDTPDLQAKATQLRSLHRIGDPVVLVNVWDVPSARTVEQAGGQAIATSSAALAAVFGLPDTDDSPPPSYFDLVGRIARAVQVPLTVDSVAGFSLGPEHLVTELLEHGAVGCNLEDTDHQGDRTGMVPAEAHADRIAAVREHATRLGVDIVINARVDTLVRRPHDDIEAKQADIIERSRAYLAAGADCVYPITLADPAALKAVVDAVGAPVNANPNPALPLADLAAAGAARISVGAAPWRTMDAELADRAARLLGGDGAAFVRP